MHKKPLHDFNYLQKADIYNIHLLVYNKLILCKARLEQLQ